MNELLAGGALLLIVALGLVEFSSRARRRHEDMRRTAEPLASIIPWRSLIRDGVCRLTGDRLQVTWELEGQELTAASRGRYAAYIDSIHRAIMSRSDADYENWQLNITTRLDESGGHIDGPQAIDPTTGMLAWARRKRFAKRGHSCLQRLWITATYKPPSAVRAALERFAIDSDEDVASTKLETAMAAFEKGITEIDAGLRSRFRKARRLGGIVRTDADGFEYIEDEQLRFLLMCGTGIDEPVVRPPVGLIQRVLGSVDYSTGFEPRVGRKFIKVIAIEEFARRSYPGDFDFLADLKIPHMHQTRAIFMSKREAEERYKKAGAEHAFTAVSIGDRMMGLDENSATFVNSEKQAMQSEAAELIGDVTDSDIHHLEWTSAVILMDEDRKKLRHAAGLVEKRIRTAKYRGRIESTNAWEAFVSLLPGDESHNRSPFMLDSVNLLDLAQLSTVDVGPTTHPNTMLPPGSPALATVLTHGNAMKNIVDSVGQVMHVLVMGETGEGKSSTALATAAWGQAQYPGEYAFLFDRGRSSDRWARAVAGEVHAIDPGDRRGFAFFDGIEDEGVLIRRKGLLSKMLESRGVPVSPARDNRLEKALRVLSRSSRRSMTLFQSKLGVFDDEQARALDFYTVSGSCGYLFDAETDRFCDARVQAFELQRLMQLKDDSIIAPLLFLIFDRMGDLLLDPTSKGRIIIDEPKDFFRHPVLATQFEQELDMARKRRTGVTITCLRPTDLLEWKIGSAVAGACATKMVFRVPGADPGVMNGVGVREKQGNQFEALTRLGFTEEDCVKITALPPYRFLLKQDERSAVINADLDPVELLFVAANDKDSLAETDAIRAQFPQTWPAELAERHGFSEAAAVWRAEAERLAFRMPDAVEDVQCLTA